MKREQIDRLYQQATTKVAYGGGPMMHGPIEPQLVQQAVESLRALQAERDAAVKRAEWYRKLAIAFGTKDIGMNAGGLYIGGGHISKDRISPCERDADGLPVETKEIREAIE